MTLSAADLTNYFFFLSFTVVQTACFAMCVGNGLAQSLRENLTYEEEKSIQQEYFEYVMANTRLEMPNTCEEGIQLYQTLLNIAGVNE